MGPIHISQVVEFMPNGAGIENKAESICVNFPLLPGYNRFTMS